MAALEVIDSEELFLKTQLLVLNELGARDRCKAHTIFLRPERTLHGFIIVFLVSVRAAVVVSHFYSIFFFD